MNKAGITVFALLFSLFFILPGMSIAHEGAQGESQHADPGHQKMEEGSGSSAMESSSEAKEYKEEDIGEEEGIFSYKRHRQEMKEKKVMEEGMEIPASTGAADTMKEGSGM